MKLRKISTRAVVAGATVALAAGALVGVTGTAANADTGTADYLCTNGFTPDVLPLSLSASGDLTSFPAFPSGMEVPTGTVAVELAINLTEEVVAGIKEQGFDSAGAASDSMSFPFGSSTVPVEAFDIPAADLPESGPFTMTATVTNATFNLPNAGSIAVKMPTAFSLTNVVPIPLDCTISGEPATITTYTVTKQGSFFTKAKGPKKAVKKGKVAKLSVAVAGDNKAATGKVVAKEGKKSVGSAKLKNGKATISVKKLKPGKHKIVVTYAGDKSTTGTESFPITVTVKKK